MPKSEFGIERLSYELAIAQGARELDMFRNTGLLRSCYSRLTT